MNTSIYIAIPIMILLAVLQTAVLPLFPVFGFVLQLPVLAALAWGLLRGPQEGAGWGFVGGLCLDLFSAAPFGSSAIALVIATGIISIVQMNLPTSRFVAPIILGGFGSLIFLYVYTFVVRLAGQPFSWSVMTIFQGQALLQAFLMVPVYWLLYGLISLIYPARVASSVE